ncbi:MAG: restriction endonuclease [Candidatus Binataceae bacterium]
MERTKKALDLTVERQSSAEKLGSIVDRSTFADVVPKVLVMLAVSSSLIGAVSSLYPTLSGLLRDQRGVEFTRGLLLYTIVVFVSILAATTLFALITFVRGRRESSESSSATGLAIQRGYEFEKTVLQLLADSGCNVQIPTRGRRYDAAITINGRRVLIEIKAPVRKVPHLERAWVDQLSAAIAEEAASEGWIIVKDRLEPRSLGTNDLVKFMILAELRERLQGFKALRPGKSG